jgi:hypothetical protein
LLQLHGVADGRVPVETADEFVIALARLGCGISVTTAWPAPITARILWCASPVSDRSSTKSSPAP